MSVQVSKCVCVCVFGHFSHRGSALSQYAALFSVCATIQPRKLCALQSDYHFAVTPLDLSFPVQDGVRVYVCVCMYKGKEAVTFKETAKK